METAEMGHRGREAAAGGARQARDRMADMLSDRSTRAAESSRGMADDARSVGEELRRRGRDRAADMAETAADRVERMGAYLDRSDGATIMEDATRYGRRHPAMVAIGGFAAGLAAARFVKAGDAPRTSAPAGHEDAGRGIPAPGGDRAGIRPAGSPS